MNEARRLAWEAEHGWRLVTGRDGLPKGFKNPVTGRVLKRRDRRWWIGEGAWLCDTFLVDHVRHVVNDAGEEALLSMPYAPVEWLLGPEGTGLEPIQRVAQRFGAYVELLGDGWYGEGTSALLLRAGDDPRPPV